MLTPGALLVGRYSILGLIGRGGMGAVYEARDQRLDSVVALKECFFTDEPMRRQFEREARILARLRHPAVTRVIDHFSEGDGQFLVMEFIGGPDLGQLLKERRSPFPPAHVLRWGDQLLDALDYLHGQDPAIIHRDIKPNNLKLTSRDQIILLDFGLAKGSGGHTTATPASVFAFTPSYAPLEQIQGSGTDARSDLFALAATLYTLITNAAPPDALTRATAMVQRNADPLRSASDVNPGVTTAVASVLTRGMALQQEDRFPTAAAMRQALREASDPVPSPAPPALPAITEGSTVQVTSTPSAVAVGPSSARRSVLAAISIIIFVLLIGIAAWLGLRGREGDQTAAQSADVARGPAGAPGLSAAGGNAVAPGALQQTLNGHAKGVTAVAFSPDGDYIVTSDQEGKVRLWRAHDGTVADMRAVDEIGKDATAVAFSPDGTGVAVALSFSPALNAGVAVVIERHGDKLGAVKTKLTDRANLISHVAFSHSGRSIAGGGTGGTVHLWDPHTGAVQSALSGDGYATRRLAFSPDDRMLAVAGMEWGVKLWNPNSGKVVRTFSGHTNELTAVAFSPGGEALASAGYDWTVRIWDVGTGTARHTLSSDQIVPTLAFSRDGRLLVGAAGSSIAVWDVQTGALATTLKGHDGTIADLAFSPDGRALASAAADGTVRIWTAPSTGQ